MSLVSCGVGTGEARLRGTGEEAGLAGSVSAGRERASATVSLGFVDTRPVSGPSFAGNHAYLGSMDAVDAPGVVGRRRTSDRPMREARWRIMTAMPATLASVLRSARGDRSGRRFDGSVGL